MKLFSDSTKNSNGDAVQRQNKTSQKIVVISPRQEVLAEISSLLLMHNIKNVVEHEADFFTLEDDKLTQGALAVIVDIVNISNTSQIIETATLLISATSRQVFVGNNDSIMFAQSLMRSGICYLHVGSQLTQLIEQVQEPEQPLSSSRTTMKVSILGCKGGVGASLFSYQLFQATGLLSSIPTLLVQGASGSSDMDLLMANALPRDGSIFKMTENQSVRIETQDGAWVYDDVHFNQFNLVFFDHGIYTQPHDRLEMVVAQSHTIILLISRELTALRVAKTILDGFNRIILTRSDWKTRILICLNENHPYGSGELKNEDIKEYLGCELSCINHYDSKAKKVTSSSPVYQFAAYLLGKPVAEPSRKHGTLLPTLLRRCLPLR